MKRIYYLLWGSFALIIFVSILSFLNVKNEHSDKHLEVVLRNIGHQLLLHSKDSSSRVLPVTIINKNIYQISFESNFGFMPDTLMVLVHQQLAKTKMPKDYIVSVKECNENKTVFAYEINSFNGDLKPCRERKQEAGCYLIQIEFLTEKSFNYIWLLSIFPTLAFASFYFYRRQNKQVYDNMELKENLDKEISVSDKYKMVAEVLEYKRLGEFKFFDQNSILVLGEKKIELSEKENKALKIFFSNQNFVVERNTLKKELWEDEGVFVIDRNVDVLVSKLRKKISDDISLKIVNVHSKGYKLMIN